MPEGGLEQVAAEIAGVDLADFFDALVRGTGELPLQTLLASHALDFHLRRAGSRTDKGGKPATLAGLQGEVDIAGGGVHEHIEFIKAGKLRNLQQTGAKDLEVPGVGTLRSVGGMVPSLESG